MLINKIGQQHIDYGVNCQDCGVINDKIKIVCDGCSEGKYSEIGSISFCYLMKNHLDYCNYWADYHFKQLIDIYGKSPEIIKNFLCFTFLSVIEKDNIFTVNYCGDGFIIKQRLDDTIDIEELNDGEYPKYFSYNYIDEKYLKYYKEGVIIRTKSYPKSEYKKIGIASDGLRYIYSDKDIMEKFIELLKNDKEVALKRLINKNQVVFKDDITIAF